MHGHASLILIPFKQEGEGLVVDASQIELFAHHSSPVLHVGRKAALLFPAGSHALVNQLAGQREGAAGNRNPLLLLLLPRGS